MTLWLCLLVLLIGQIVVACGGETGNPGANGEGPVELTLWVNPLASEAPLPDANWELYKIVREKLNVDLKITFLPDGSEATTKLNAAAAANSLPDLFQITNNEIFLKWVDLGLVAPVNDLLPLMPERTKARYSDEKVNKLYTINGKLYALQEPGQLTKRTTIFIRQDWLDKLGLQTPKTLDEMLEVAKAFTTRDPDGNGKNDTYGFGAFAEEGIGLGGKFAGIYGAYGIPNAWDYSTPGKVSLSLRNPNYLKATQFIRQMIEEKVIDPDWPTMKTDDFRARWKQGRYGIFAEDFCALSCLANYKPFDENFPNGLLVPLDPFTGSSDTPYVGSFVDAGFRMGMSKKGMDAGKGPAAAKFLEWLHSGEGYYMACFGKEGVNYKLDAQGNILADGVPEPFTENAPRKVMQLRNMANNGSETELNARYPAFQTKSGRTQEPMKVYNTIGAMPWLDVTSTYIVKPASNQADINRYISENMVQFVTGRKPLNDESWNSFIKSLDGLGVSEWEASSNALLKERGFL